MVHGKRVLLKDATLPGKYWTDTGRTALYLHNRLVLQLEGVFPCEALHNRRPVIDHIRTFDIRGFFQVNREARKRLDNASDPALFFGHHTVSR